MYYTYILRSSKSKIFYYGSTKDLKKRFSDHNNGLAKATKPYRPWKLVFYSAFETFKQAKDFEKYLKSGSGKAFAYKRLVNVALAKDVKGRISIPES
ncbi:hypothetical protein A3J17_03085 [Candidatus Curtissbacteria bacterium RIFCSPLOWO2_02_FULL_40_11]|nr:MAG: hypothetical protein A3J17_03085 [Candidatus Curtissbacteria bacterium RIFCSPLOWO2_02_FULL_40_11]